MKTYIVTFGTGDETVNLIEQARNISDLLGRLRLNGWEVDEITSIKLG